MDLEAVGQGETVEDLVGDLVGHLDQQVGGVVPVQFGEDAVDFLLFEDFEEASPGGFVDLFEDFRGNGGVEDVEDEAAPVVVDEFDDLSDVAGAPVVEQLAEGGPVLAFEQGLNLMQ